MDSNETGLLAVIAKGLRDLRPEFRTLATLPGFMQATRRALASALRTKAKRPGLLFAAVGPHFSRSYSWRS